MSSVFIIPKQDSIYLKVILMYDTTSNSGVTDDVLLK